MGLRGKDRGASQGRPVMGRIGVVTSPYPKGGRLHRGVGGCETSANRRRGRRRNVGAVVTTVAGAASATEDISVAGTVVVTRQERNSGRAGLRSGSVLNELVFEVAGDAAGQFAQFLHEPMEFGPQFLAVLGQPIGIDVPLDVTVEV